MKRYRKFMDGVKASGTLHQRLVELETPKKGPGAWIKYGAMAAALVLVCGLGVWGLSGGFPFAAGHDLPLREIAPENVDVGQPDIAPEESGDAAEPKERTLGGYDVTTGSGPEAMVAHYILPYIDYGTAEAGWDQKISMDWAIQEGAAERELTREEAVALLGGADAVSDHLDWDAYELTGRMWQRPDGSMLLAFLYGYQGELDHFEFAVMDGELPPTCIAYEGSVTQEVRGLTVTADKYDGEYGCDRRVSFMKDNYGYRFDLTATDAERAELLVSRLVCRIADEGLALWTLDSKVETYTCPTCGEVLDEDEKAHVHSFPGVGEPNWDDGAPAVSAQPGYTCPECGETVPAGMPHDCAMCDGYPVPHTCEICGEIYPEGTAHQHEVCGLPLAPDTHTCEVCGQILPAGAEHSHRPEHDQDHHSNHH